MDQSASQPYREYIGEIPHNMIKMWGTSLFQQLPWDFMGWSGIAKEPYRHWAAYPKMEGEVKKIWETINFSLKEDGFNLEPERIIANLFNHGDSCWLHRDCDSDTDWTVLIFLNDHWNINWGADFVLVDDNHEIIKSFAPTPGKFVVFKSNLLHGPRAVSREAPYPRFSLAFQCNGNNLQGFSQAEVSTVSATQL